MTDDTAPADQKPLTEREWAQVSDLNAEIERLSAAIAAGDRRAAAEAARAVEVDAMHLGLMLRGGRR